MLFAQVWKHWILHSAGPLQAFRFCALRVHATDVEFTASTEDCHHECSTHTLNFSIEIFTQLRRLRRGASVDKHPFVFDSEYRRECQELTPSTPTVNVADFQRRLYCTPVRCRFFHSYRKSSFTLEWFEMRSRVTVARRDNVHVLAFVLGVGPSLRTAFLTDTLNRE